MPSTPLCRCRVSYIGCAVPTITKDGLQGIQEPLKDRYNPHDSEHVGIDAKLSIFTNGLLLEYVSGAEEPIFFPIQNLHYCAAVRYVRLSDRSDQFLPLDSPLAMVPDTRHPPMFAAMLRRASGVRVLECHGFICRSPETANALVRCCFHAYADSMYMKMTGGPNRDLLALPAPPGPENASMGSRRDRSQSSRSPSTDSVNENGYHGDDSDREQPKPKPGKPAWAARQQSGEYDSYSMASSQGDRYVERRIIPPRPPSEPAPYTQALVPIDMGDRSPQERIYGYGYGPPPPHLAYGQLVPYEGPPQFGGPGSPPPPMYPRGPHPMYGAPPGMRPRFGPPPMMRPMGPGPRPMMGPPRPMPPHPMMRPMGPYPHARPPRPGFVPMGLPPRGPPIGMPLMRPMGPRPMPHPMFHMHGPPRPMFMGPPGMRPDGRPFSPEPVVTFPPESTYGTIRPRRAFEEPIYMPGTMPSPSGIPRASYQPGSYPQDRYDNYYESYARGRPDIPPADYPGSPEASRKKKKKARSREARSESRATSRLSDNGDTYYYVQDPDTLRRPAHINERGFSNTLRREHAMEDRRFLNGYGPSHASQGMRNLTVGTHSNRL